MINLVRMGAMASAGGVSFAKLTSTSRPAGASYRRIGDGYNASGWAQETNILTLADSSNPSAYPTTVSAFRVSPTQDRVVLVLSNSIGLGTGAESFINKWVRRYYRETGNRIDVINRSVNGQGWLYDYTGGTAPAINADATAEIASIVSAYGAANVTVIAWECTNDAALKGDAPATVVSSAMALGAICTAAGIPAGKIVFPGMLPRGTGGGQYSEVNRASINSGLSTACGTNGHIFLAWSSSIYANGSQSGANYIADNIHLSDAGELIACNDLYSVIPL